MDHLRLFPTHHTLRLLLLFIRCTKIYSISNFVKVSIYSSIPQPRLTAVEFIDQDSPNFKTSFFPNIDPLILKFEWNDGEVQSRNHNGHYVHFFFDPPASSCHTILLQVCSQFRWAHRSKNRKDRHKQGPHRHSISC